MKSLVTTLGLMLAFCTSTLMAQEVDLTGIKCIVSGKRAAKSSASVDYKGGKVYFCCGNCVKAFNEDVKLKDKAQYTVKANHQLVLTGQFEQKGCPFSGGPVDENLMTDVGGTKVGFCCGNCQKKVAGAEKLEAKASLVFSEVAFKKGFKKAAAEPNLEGIQCMMMPKKGVSTKHGVEYNGGMVYFCCGGCAKKFKKNPEQYATQANHQLVKSGQFVQTGCPISGGGVDDEQVSEVGGVNVNFCCGKCKGKVDSAADDAAKAELVFGAKRFSKAFSAK